MNKKLISLIICVCGFLSVALAQEEGRITVKGTVLDSRTGEPVAFANMGLLGTVAGVATDMEGKFELTVPDRYATYVLRVSAVGYSHAEMKLYEMRDKPGLVIKMNPVTYGIGAVDVYGELLIYKKMLQNVVNNISKNYLVVPYNYEGYFKYAVNVNGVEKVKEATVTIYDNEGYSRENPEATFKQINYTFNQVRRGEEPTSVLDGLTYLDDILTADIVRNTRNVLDIVNSRDYKLKSKGKMLYEGDSVQVITYTATKPTISTTGDPDVQSYTGEIYINLKDMAVLKNITNITSRNFTSLGRNLIPINEKPKTNVEMKITTTYKKLKSIYFLNGINIEYAYKEEGNDVKGKMEYITTRIKKEQPTVIEGRLYYEDIKANEDFWNRYSIYFQE